MGEARPLRGAHPAAVRQLHPRRPPRRRMRRERRSRRRSQRGTRRSARRRAVRHRAGARSARCSTPRPPAGTRAAEDVDDGFDRRPRRGAFPAARARAALARNGRGRRARAHARATRGARRREADRRAPPARRARPAEPERAGRRVRLLPLPRQQQRRRRSRTPPSTSRSGRSRSEAEVTTVLEKLCSGESGRILRAVATGAAATHELRALPRRPRRADPRLAARARTRAEPARGAAGASCASAASRSRSSPSSPASASGLSSSALTRTTSSTRSRLRTVALEARGSRVLTEKENSGNDERAAQTETVKELTATNQSLTAQNAELQSTSNDLNGAGRFASQAEQEARARHRSLQHAESRARGEDQQPRRRLRLAGVPARRSELRARVAALPGGNPQSGVRRPAGAGETLHARAERVAPESARARLRNVDRRAAMSRRRRLSRLRALRRPRNRSVIPADARRLGHAAPASRRPAATARGTAREARSSDERGEVPSAGQHGCCGGSAPRCARRTRSCRGRAPRWLPEG